MSVIPPIEPFVVEGPPSTQAPKWKEWVERLLIYFEATKVHKEQKRALLLHLGGKDIHRIIKTQVEVTPKTHNMLINALNGYFEPMANQDYERFIFRQARQMPDESLDAFHARLQNLATTCAFRDEMEEICGQIIQGCASAKLRERILEEFDTVFEGIGKYKGKEIHLHIDHTVQPVALRHRRVAFHLRPLVEEELVKIEGAGIIEKVTGPTHWVSPIVITRKPKQPGAVKICVDMRIPNAAIKRERHLTPTIDDLIGEMDGACWFTKLDLRSGYHQLVLDQES